MEFVVPNVRGDKLLLHLTAWRNEHSLNLLIQSGTTFAKLLDEGYPNYITSVDIPVKVLDPSVSCNQATLRPSVSVSHFPGSPTYPEIITVTATTSGTYDKIIINVRDSGGRPVNRPGTICLWPSRFCEFSASLPEGLYDYEAKLLDADNKELARSDTRQFRILSNQIPPF